MSSRKFLLDKLFSKFVFGDKNNDNSYIPPYNYTDCGYTWENFNNYLDHLKYCRSDYIKIFADRKGVKKIKL